MRPGRFYYVPYVFLLLLLILVFNTLKTDSGEERWSSRKLAKGEPSGERTDLNYESGPGVSESPMISGLAEEEGENISAKEVDEEGPSSIKISVTLPTALNNNNYQKYNQRLEVYKERKKRISSTCRKYGLGRFQQTKETNQTHQPWLDQRSQLFREMEATAQTPTQNSFMWQKNWHLLYCWIHKVASSSWSQIFFNLVGKQVPSSRLHEAAQYFHPNAAELSSAMSNSLVFTFVRHPFERLVSAYRDKFELAKKHAYVYSRYANKILKKTNQSKSRLTPRRRPTFREFADYLVSGWAPDYNDHWIPYWPHCHFCDLEYDVVGTMETVKDDFEFINNVSGLSSTNLTIPWTNRRNGSSDTALQYFTQLDENIVTSLIEIYRPDFEMFGYEFQPYLDLFKP